MRPVLVADLIESDEAGFACSKARLVESGLPHLRPFNIGSDGALDLGEVYQVDPSEAPKGKAQLLAGDILFNNTNSAELVGKSAVVTAPMTAGFSNHLTRVRVDHSRVEPVWFSFWLRKLQASGYFTANATQWVSQAAYRTSDLGKLPINLPPLADQQRIIDLLSRAEGIVRLRRQAQQKAAALVPAIFVDMFGDPATNPRGWAKSRLGDLAAVQGGLQVTRARESLPLDRPYLRVANVYRARLELDEVKSIRLTEAEFERTRLVYGDLLFVEGHGNPQEVGRVAIWDNSIPNCTHQNHLIRARLNSERLLPEYACWLLNSAGGRQSLLRAGKTTSGLSTISVQNVKDAEVLLPPLKIQSSFKRQVEAVEAIVALQEAAVTKAEATFNALLARAFSAAGQPVQLRAERALA